MKDSYKMTDKGFRLNTVTSSIKADKMKQLEKLEVTMKRFIMI